LNDSVTNLVLIVLSYQNLLKASVHRIKYNLTKHFGNPEAVLSLYKGICLHKLRYSFNILALQKCS